MNTEATTIAPAHIEDMIPPEEINFVGTGGFRAVGREFLGYFTELVKLQPHEHVLDVGCGIGRIAIPLTQYLSCEGRYEGFDVVPLGIEWCRNKISTRYPNFRFSLAEIHNEHYSPHASTRASQFRFPYPSASFDFVFLTSVLTHMLPADLENYVYEIARVLKPNGRCLITFFLLNREADELMKQNKGTLSFPHELPDSPCRLVNPLVPEQAVAYDEASVLRTLAKYGLIADQPVRYGHWCGRESYLSYQDVVIVRKARLLTWAQRLSRTWIRVHQPRPRGRTAR